MSFGSIALLLSFTFMIVMIILTIFKNKHGGDKM